MLGLRDVLFITPTPSSLHQQTQLISSSDHHHFHLQSHPLPSSTSLGVNVGIFPLLPPPPQSQSHPQETKDFDNLKKTHDFNFDKGDSFVNGGADNSMAVCRDCGNRAKKECEFRRCRTCCKGRGNYCSTHVRSTWVPASRRRERQMLVAVDGGDGGCGGGSSGSSSGGVKRQRVQNAAAADTDTGAVAAASHASTSNATTPRSFETSSGHQDASFRKSLPGQVRAPALFRCHRVTAITSGEGEVAYQATVNIGGHVFKGFLYDQGMNEKKASPCISQLHFESGNQHK